MRYAGCSVTYAAAAHRQHIKYHQPRLAAWACTHAAREISSASLASLEHNERVPLSAVVKWDINGVSLRLS